MTVSTDPAEIVRAVCDGVSLLVSGDLDQAQREAQLDRLAALYAERTDVRHPFAASGPPLRTRADLRRHFARSPTRADGVERFEPVGLHVHRTGIPRSSSPSSATRVAAACSIPNIFVTRVRDGVIIESRDYADHIGAARAFGHLPALAAALAAEERTQ